MKLIAESELLRLENEADCLITGDRYDLTINLMWLTDN